MNFKKYIQTSDSLRFIAENIEIMSAAGRSFLYAKEFLTSGGDIEDALCVLDRFVELAKCDECSVTLEKIRAKLMQIKDIHSTLASLEAGKVLDDLELFEIKLFAILADEIRGLWTATGCDVLHLAESAEVIDLLDPERSRVAGFYIYDLYDAELADLRKALKAAKAEGNAARAGQLEDECVAAENRIRKMLSVRLQPYAAMLMSNFLTISEMDVNLALAVFALGAGMCRPTVAREETSLVGMFNPWVANILERSGKKFQHVSISFGAYPTVITGANMAGKSVVLKTVALVQTMFQFGMYVPADEAAIAPVDEILLTIGDDQSELSGLSSYASEMLNINEIIKKVKAGATPLVLIDEPARTTNPVEGEAIVSALLRFLSHRKVRSLVTTHYGGIRQSVRRLRVRGFTGSDDSVVTIKNINRYIDYTLSEETTDTVPHEALRIARILGVDEELVETACRQLED